MKKLGTYRRLYELQFAECGCAQSGSRIVKHTRPTMPIRSMTGFAQVRGEVQRHGCPSPLPRVRAPTAGSAFTLSLKSVNHRFLDLHFRLPSGTDSLEMQLRRLLKEKMARGHVEVTLSLDRSTSETFSLESRTGRRLHQPLSALPPPNSLLPPNPILTPCFVFPARSTSADDSADGEIEAAVMARVGEALDRFNQMREEEGRGIVRELRERMAHLGRSRQERPAASPRRPAELRRAACSPACRNCWVPASSSERILQEAALLVDRSDIQEEIVRLETHVQHFLGLARSGWRNRQEAGFPAAGNESRGQHSTFEDFRAGRRSAQDHRSGLAMKSEIEKSREQVQNLE